MAEGSNGLPTQTILANATGIGLLRLKRSTGAFAFGGAEVRLEEI